MARLGSGKTCRLLHLMALGIGILNASSLAGTCAAPVPKGGAEESDSSAPASPGSTALRPDAAAPAQPAQPPAESLPDSPANQAAQQLHDALAVHHFPSRRQFLQDHRNSFRIRIETDGYPMELLQEIYESRRFHPVLFNEHPDHVLNLSDEGAALAQLLTEVQSHGLDPDEFHVQEIAAAIAPDTGLLSVTRNSYLSAKQRCESTKSQLQGRFVKLWKALEKLAEPPSLPALAALASEYQVTPDDLPEPDLLEHLLGDYNRMFEAKMQLNKAVQGLDVRLLGGFFRLTEILKYSFRTHPKNTPPGTQPAWSPFVAQLRQDYQLASGNLPAYLASQYPSHATYERLRAQLIEFRLRASQAGPSSTASSARPGHGAPTAAVPPSLRVQQIELALQRWRESPLTRVKPVPEFYILVNIPQFELEVWERGQLVRSHKVIVGNHKVEKDESAMTEGFLNHTPVLAATVDKIIINPEWIPGPRIRAKLLKKGEAKLRKDGWIITRNSKEVFLRLRGGDKNDLGRVKFTFPNQDAVYLHDTPYKHRFKQSRRALSHGCVRVEKAEDLAKYLLSHVNNLSEADYKLKRDARDKHKRSILSTESLAQPIPIFIEYMTATASETGEARFFEDVYDYDAAYFAGRLPCE